MANQPQYVKTVKTLLPQIDKLYGDLGLQGELYKLSEIAKPKIAGIDVPRD